MTSHVLLYGIRFALVYFRSSLKLELCPDMSMSEGAVKIRSWLQPKMSEIDTLRQTLKTTYIRAPECRISGVIEHI